jgi:hypothetical protein
VSPSFIVHDDFLTREETTGLALAVMFRCTSRVAIGFLLTFDHGDKLPIVFFSMTIALNLYLTTAIIIKLWKARSALLELGPSMTAHSQPYTTVIGMFVESALPYTASGIFYIGTVIHSSSVQFISGRFFFVSAVRPFSPSMGISQTYISNSS